MTIQHLLSKSDQDSNEQNNKIKKRLSHYWIDYLRSHLDQWFLLPKPSRNEVG